MIICIFPQPGWCWRTSLLLWEERNVLHRPPFHWLLCLLRDNLSVGPVCLQYIQNTNIIILPLLSGKAPTCVAMLSAADKVRALPSLPARWQGHQVVHCQIVVPETKHQLPSNQKYLDELQFYCRGHEIAHTWKLFLALCIRLAHAMIGDFS